MILGIIKKQQRQLLATGSKFISQTSATTGAFPTRYFTTETAAPVGTPEELAKAREEWGEKYSDECFKFEAEWKQIADKIETEYFLLLHHSYIGNVSTSRTS